jgi:hemoglobin
MKIYPEDVFEHWIRKVSSDFYDRVYAHSWLSQVFLVPKDHITSQQIDFIIGAMGGPKRYSGRNPGDAHVHIFISEEMWNVREALLVQAFETVDCPADIREQWIKIENAFRKSIVMVDSSECRKRYLTDELIIIPRAR